MASSSSIVLPSIYAKTPIFTKALNPSISFFSPSLSLRALSSKPISISSTSLLPSRTCRFLPKVAVYDDQDQEQEEDLSNGRGGGGGGGGRSDANFPPELKLFVGNLPFTVDSGELAGLFGQAGNVEVVEVIYDKVTGRSRGFGFVTMSTPEEAQAAERQFNGYELDGRPIRVNSGPPPRKDEGSSFRGSRGGGSSFDSSNRLYVGNLSWAVDDEALADLFSEQGTVTDCKVVFDRETGRSRGFGFVTYSTAEEVNNAISSLNGVDLKGREIRVTVAEARPPRRQY